MTTTAAITSRAETIGWALAAVISVPFISQPETNTNAIVTFLFWIFPNIFSGERKCQDFFDNAVLVAEIKQ